jgi:hypothetical protein
MDLDGVADANAACSIAEPESHTDEGEQDDDDDTDLLPTLKPVRFWGDQSKTSALEPGINLLSSKRVPADNDDDDLLKSKAEGQRATSIHVSSSTFQVH